jgi:HEAT repeat protein
MRIFIFAGLVVAILLAARAPAYGQTKDSEINGKRLDQWLKDMQDKDASVVERAIQNIWQFGQGARDTAGPAIILATGSLDTSVRVNAAIAVGMIGLNEKDMERGVNALIRLLNDTQAIVRFQATMSLGRLGPAAKAAIPKLAKDTINDKTAWEIRKAAAYSIGSIAADPKLGPDSTAINALIGALRDPCAQVRLGAVAGLGVLAPAAKPQEQQAVQSGMKGVLNDRDKSVVIGAYMVLLQLDKASAPQYVKQTAGFLKYPDMDVRINAAQALGSLGANAKGEIFTLIDCLATEKQNRAATEMGLAISHLKEFVTEKHIAAIAKLLQSTETVQRARGAQTLGLLGEAAKSQIPALMAALEDRENQVLIMACLALGQMGKYANKALPRLTDLTNHPDEAVQQAAFDAIDRIGGKDKK